MALLPLLLACAPDAVAWRAPAAALTLEPASLAFPATPVGAATTLTVTLRNDGAAAGAWNVSVAAPFAVDRTRVELGAGGTAIINVRFAPEGWYDVGGHLHIDGTDPVPLAGPVLTDADADGAHTTAAGGDDCDDTDPAVHPGAPETCGDGLDADCVPANDDDCDADGFSATFDCDDMDATAFPGGTETGPDGVDEDCDGRVDELLLAPGDLVLTELAPQAPAWVELCNVTDRAIPVGGFDLATRAGTHTLPAGTIDAGACAAVCASTLDDCAFTTSLELEPTQDTVVVAVEGRVLDAVAIDAGWAWQPGAVWSVDPASAEADANNAAGAWCRTLGSPGEPNEGC